MLLYRSKVEGLALILFELKGGVAIALNETKQLCLQQTRMSAS
jgi:hypothetical protein